MDDATKRQLVEFLLRLADDRLILGHRLSEWCGHAPILEEDIALTNFALDLIGQTIPLYEAASELEGKGRSADDFAYLREAIEFKNAGLVERPNGDFAHTIARQFFFDVYSYYLMEQLQSSSHEALAGVAEKALKEDRYHLRHTSEWMLRLGDGTEESRKRMQEAVDALWRYTGELFAFDQIEAGLQEERVLPDLQGVEVKWTELVSDILERATLVKPEAEVMVSGTRLGRHSEHLGYILAEMQILPRSYPGASW